MEKESHTLLSDCAHARPIERAREREREDSIADDLFHLFRRVFLIDNERVGSLA